jgi:GAF domain-containing protein
VRTATHLLHCECAHFWRLREGQFQLVAHIGTDPKFADYMIQHPISSGRSSLAGRAALERRTVHIPDVLADPEYTNLEYQRIGKFRTMLGVPLLRDGVPIGVIALLRNIVKPFTQKQIELVTTFADQAVIAIENARLFEEVQARTRDLTRSVAELRALGAVGQAVSSSLELKVVLARILEHACAMSDTGGGGIYVFDKARAQFDLEAGHNMSEALITAVRRHPIRFGETVVGQCAERREAVQFADLTEAPPHALYVMHIKSGVRALLAVPLLN